MITFLRDSLHQYAEKKNTEIITVFAVAGLIAAGFAWLYVYFIGRHQSGFFLRYLLSFALLAGGVIFILIARSSRDGWAAIAYAVLGVMLGFGAIVSFVAMLILYGFIYIPGI